MFKIILLIITLLAFCDAYSNHVTPSTLTATSGYVYGPPQGANFNYDVAKNYGQYNNAATSWSTKHQQFPNFGGPLNHGYNSGYNSGYNTGFSALSALSPPAFGHGYHQFNQGYYTPGYNNMGGYYSSGYNNRPYPYQNFGGYRDFGGYNYNRPYYSTIQHRN